MDLLGSELFPFTVAAGFMLATGAVQAIGMDFDLGVDVDINYLSWLGLGRIPFMMLITILLGSFAFIGYAIEILAPGLLRAPLNAFVAAGGSVASSALLAPALTKIIPQDETTSVKLDDLTRRRATVTLGTATSERPAQATVRDMHGKSHNIWVQPSASDGPIAEGEEVLLAEFDATTRIFTAIPVNSILRPIS